jgi:hypothetical protein
MGDPFYAGIGHAVPAPQVTPVGDRYPYIINAPSIQIYKGHHLVYLHDRLFHCDAQVHLFMPRLRVLSNAFTCISVVLPCPMNQSRIQTFLTQILRLDVPIIASCISGGPKHNTHSDHGIVYK